MSSSTQAESVIKNIIREICLECSGRGHSVSETLAAFMVSSAFYYFHLCAVYNSACKLSKATHNSMHNSVYFEVGVGHRPPRLCV